MVSNSNLIRIYFKDTKCADHPKNKKENNLRKNIPSFFYGYPIDKIMWALSLMRALSIPPKMKIDSGTKHTSL